MTLEQEYIKKYIKNLVKIKELKYQIRTINDDIIQLQSEYSKKGINPRVCNKAVKELIQEEKRNKILTKKENFKKQKILREFNEICPI